MKTDKANVTVIIRSVGERTEQLCKALILEQGVPEENLVIIHQAPFSAALRKSYQIGIERNFPWTFCIDADVLLRPGAVDGMLALAAQQADNVCEIQGYILDKFFGGPRIGGIHLYRSSLLPRVIQHIPQEGHAIRPEYTTLKKMHDLGFPRKVVPFLVGLHDFEQYYRDIYRKCFVHAHKHRDLSGLFLELWQDRAEIDRDYLVALLGFADGIIHLGDVFIDINSEHYHQTETKLPYQEKEKSISINDLPAKTIESTLKNWVEPAIYTKHFPTKAGLSAMPFWGKIKMKRIEMGYYKTALFVIGSLMSRAGSWLDDLSKV